MRKHLSKIDSETYCFSIWYGEDVTSLSIGSYEKTSKKHLQCELEPLGRNWMLKAPIKKPRSVKPISIKPKKRGRHVFADAALRKKLEQFLK